MKLKGRRKLRVAALQSLYSLDLMEEWERYENFTEDTFQREHIEDERDREFVKSRTECVLKNKDTIDSLIKETLKGWTFERLNVIERNILRLGICELLFCGDIPYKVAINEAVELAKIFAEDRAPSLINGILDRIATEKGVKK